MHASALKIGLSSFAFLGRSGSGKSSLVADLYANHEADFICEDVACIDYNDAKFSIKNAPPLIKLSEEISNIIKFNQDNKINLIADRLNRSFYKVRQKECRNVLNACFFLEWGNSFSIKKLEDDEFLPAFLISTYSSYPFNSCLESSKDFHQNIQKFQKKIPIFKLTRKKHNKFKDGIKNY